MAKPRPTVIIFYNKDTDTLGWMSDGWGRDKKLMDAAHDAIVAAVDVPDAVNLLTKAGFKVEQQ